MQHVLAERLLKTIRKQDLIRAGDRLAVAVSGGADSIALLLLLLELRSELGAVLSVAHVNHKLRGEESDADASLVASLAEQQGLELCAHTAAVSPLNSGIEASARELRYTFFRQLGSDHGISKIATAHTLDDQAETVLMRILRGTGIRGLAGILPRLRLDAFGRTADNPIADACSEAPLQGRTGRCGGEVIRPLLSFRRSELLQFLREKAQVWREDSTNRDLSFLRNRVRHIVLPMLEENFGPTVVHNLADLAEIARAEEEELASRPERELGGMETSLGGGQALPLEPGLLSLPLATRRRIVRTWLEAALPPSGISFRVIEDVLELAVGPAGQRLELPRGITVRRAHRDLRFEPAGRKRDDYEYVLPIPGAVEIPELGIRVQANILDVGNTGQLDSAQLLDLERLPSALKVRNWRPGDRFWPPHTKAEKKVKELLSDRHVTGAEKKLWPVIVAGADLVWVRGFATPTVFQPPPDATRVLAIHEEDIL